MQNCQYVPFTRDLSIIRHIFLFESFVAFSQLVSIDVILEHGLLHVVADHGAEGTHAVTLLVLLQFVSGYAGETLLAVTTHQRLLGGRNRDECQER